VEGAVKGDLGEGGGPDGHRGVDEETASQPGEAVTDKGEADGVAAVSVKQGNETGQRDAYRSW
jgi:hypothetical protein